MESVRLVLFLSGAAALSLGAYSLWAYLVSGRHRERRLRLEQVVAQVLRDTGHGKTFLFIVGRNVRALEVRLPAPEAELQAFRQILAAQLRQEFPRVQLSVVPLTESLEHLHGSVAAWGRLHGDVYVGRGGAEHAA